MEWAQERIYKLDSTIYSEDNNPVWEGKTNKDKENLTASEDEADDQPSRIAHTDHRSLRSWRGGWVEKTFQEINSDDITKLMKNINLHIKEAQQDQSRKKLRYTPRYIHPKGDAKGECKT